MPVPEPPPAPSRHPAGRLREWTRRAFGASRTGGGQGFSLWRQAAVIAAAGVFMTLTGPFGASQGSLAVRLAYWLGMLTAGTVLANVLGGAAVRMELFERRPWLWALIIAAIITPLQTVVVWVTSGLVFLGGLRLALLPTYGLPVLIVTLAMVALTVLTQRTPLQTHARPPVAGADDGPGASREDVAPAEPAFARRLPPRLRGAEILAVEAEDHYLRLHTSRGQDLILMRLADAIAELEGMEGAQVHRSWWVARAAVVGAERGGGRASLTLRDGAVAPVSRTYARALREAGWY